MKLNFPLNFSAVLALVLALGVNAMDLEWTGQVEMNKENVTISGTAESIYKEIIAINPNYDYEFGIHSNATAEIVEKRDTIGTDTRCGIGGLVSASLDVSKGISYLYNIGNGNCAAPPGRPGAGGCSRVSCDHDDAIWLCNDLPRQLNIPCRIAADNAQGVYSRCQNSKQVWQDGCPGKIGCAQWTFRTIGPGQIFSMDHTWNVIVGSRSCSESPNKNPF